MITGISVLHLSIGMGSTVDPVCHIIVVWYLVYHATVPCDDIRKVQEVKYETECQVEKMLYFQHIPQPQEFACVVQDLWFISPIFLCCFNISVCNMYLIQHHYSSRLVWFTEHQSHPLPHVILNQSLSAQPGTFHVILVFQDSALSRKAE